MKLLLLCLVIIGLSWAKSSSKTGLKTRTASLTCNCGWRNSGRIVGGKETKPNEYPWMVKLSNGCGGSIITSWHILTAAHCTIRETARSITVTVGGHRKNGGNEKYLQNLRLARIVQHEKYDNDKVVYDISVLVTASEIQFNQNVGPICMPNKKVSLIGQYVKVMGWGSSMGTVVVDGLREVDVKVVPYANCVKSWENFTTDGTQLCAYEYRKDSCGGDSGGPLVYLDPETNTFTQAALVSYGAIQCGFTPDPSVNTDVSSFIDWINRAITKTRQGISVCTKASRRILW